ncbi:MAG: cytochrome c biogenesis protein ResB [Pyrinomonadaceae bacterium]|nr:cytochrome c biogenesis protein ResB [Pyrinomonadaceae bacterium]MBP6214473.1 cytochrome c biogenesis protein ResB [Pyrinomonadaceae bacterium]
MPAAESVIEPKEAFKPKSAPIVNRILDFFSSVRFGVVLLCILVALSIAGMLILQQNVQGFDAYFVSLTPAERTVFGALGLFDIYHTWYFNMLLLVLSLNIVLASIDRFPSAWSYIVKPKVTATKAWLLARKENDIIDLSTSSQSDAASEISSVLKDSGFKTIITEKDGVTTVFGENGKWNRIGAYIVHVALLTLFLGHFVALRTGFDADVKMVPGEKTDEIQMIEFDLDKKEKFNVKLPFSMECTDIQQSLIDPTGSIDVTNTMDWRTQLRIDDPQYGVMTADVSLNAPLNYRGYRFFQAQTIPVGSARNIKLELTPVAGGDPTTISIDRNASAALADGTKIRFDQFLADFSIGQGGNPETRSGEYNNPAAVLTVTSPQGDPVRVYAFANKMPDNIPINAPKAGFKWKLAGFEKSPMAHILSIKYDPFSGAFIAWYFGGFGLMFALMFVFFFSHKRIWAMITPRDDGSLELVIAGEANRNQFGFEDKFKKIADHLRERSGSTKE